MTLKIDTEQLKLNNPIEKVIAKYLDLKKDGSGLKACCPFHTEKTPSFHVHTVDQFFKCHGCGAKGDAIKFIEKIEGVDFKKACEILGAEPTPEAQHKPKPKPAAKKKPAKIVALSYPEKAQAIFTPDELTKASGNLADGRTIKSAWKYFNEKSEVELVVVRWEDAAGKKTVLTYYYDGNKIQLKGYPVLLYNRDKLATDQEKDVLIVFGEKCADVADSLGSFIAVTWNGGEKKVNDVDFGPLKNRTVYIWPDDDQQKYANGPDKGKMMPPEEQPGRKCCAEVVKHLPHAQVVEIIPELREIEPSGADIVEALEYFGGDIAAVTQHIYQNSARVDNNSESKTTSIDSKVESKPDQETKAYPFEVLGLADDGKLYFITEEDVMIETKPTNISRNFMTALCGVHWWRANYSNGTKEGWEDATSDLVRASCSIDFDPERIRGRGAWKESDGRICYHDGFKTFGDVCDKRIYLKMTKKSIGIAAKPATADQRKRIFKVSEQLTFRGYQDVVRVLAWSIYSVFGGAFEWRPAMLLTARSESGKSTILNKIIRQLSSAKVYSGGSSTEPGIRQKVGIDTIPVVIEEFEGDTPKKRQNREDILSLMRQSTSDDSPKAAKGTQDGRGMDFILQSPFGFIGIDPAVESWADENRLFRAELVEPKHTPQQWETLSSELNEALSDEICAGVRSYTWSHLGDIVNLSKRLAVFVHEESAGRSLRTTKADAILLATFLVVIENQVVPDDEYLAGFVSFFYSASDDEQEPAHDENIELLDTILNYTIRDGSDNFSLRDLLSVIAGDLPVDADPALINMVSSRARRVAGDNGVGLTPEDENGKRHYAIAKSHKVIMKILDKGRGYDQLLYRHPDFMMKSKNVGLGGGSRTVNCVVIERKNDE